MLHHRRVLVLMLIAMALLVGIASCASPTPPPAPQATTPLPPNAQPTAPQPSIFPTKVSFRLDWIAGAQHSPFYLAKERGYYAKEGIDLDIISGSGSADAVKFLGTGSVDLALVDGLVLVQAKEKEVPLQSIAVLYQRTPISIMSPQSKPIKTPQELLNKKLGSKKGSATYQGLMVFLEANNIKPEQLQMIDVGFGAQPLLVGQVDAMMAFTMNEPVDAESSGMPVYEIMITDYGVYAYGLSIVASDKFIKEKGNLLKGFLRATKKGMEEAAKDNQVAVDALAKAVSEIDKAREMKVLSKTIPVWGSDDTKANGYGWQTDAGWQQTVDTAVRLKLIEKAPSTKNVFTNDFLK